MLSAYSNPRSQQPSDRRPTPDRAATGIGYDSFLEYVKPISAEIIKH
jgi:hypothetical protein